MYDQIFEILEQEELKEPLNLSKLKLSADAYVDSREHPWVESLFTVVDNNLNPLLEQWNRDSDLKVVATTRHLRGDTFSTKWQYPFQQINKEKLTLVKKDFHAAAGYSCIFPNQLIYLTRPFTIGPAHTNAIPIEFLYLLLVMKPLLKNKIAFLAPPLLKQFRSRTRLTDFVVDNLDLPVGEKVDKAMMYKAMDEQEVHKWKSIQLPFSGKGKSKLSKVMDNQNITEYNTQALRISYLHGLEFERYVQLIKKHPKEFNLYNAFLKKTLNKPEASKNDIKEWLKEANYRVEKINRRYEKKKKELQSKGITVGIGTLFTVGSIFLPGVGEIISGLLGGKTISDGINWILDYKDLDQTMSEDDFWFLWKLKNYGEDEEGITF